MWQILVRGNPCSSLGVFKFSWKKLRMNKEKIEFVLSENLGEGFRIVYENGQTSPVIEWVDWVQLSALLRFVES